MKRFLFLGLLGSAAVVQSSFNPLLLKGTTDALMQAVEGLKIKDSSFSQVVSTDIKPKVVLSLEQTKVLEEQNKNLESLEVQKKALKVKSKDVDSALYGLQQKLRLKAPISSEELQELDKLKVLQKDLLGQIKKITRDIESQQKSLNSTISQGKSLQVPEQNVTGRLLTDAEKKLYEDCAPFWGLMYIEKGIAEQWYRLSPKYMYKGFTPEQLEEIKKSGRVIENNPIENLIAQMYHIAGETFAVTSASHNVVQYLNPKNIGHVLRIINDFLAKETFDKEGLQQQLLDYLKITIKQDLKERGYSGTKQAYLTQFVVPLVESIVECQKKDSAYTKSTPQQLLISYMLAKSENRDDLQEYMRGLLGDEAFTLSHEKYSHEEILEILKYAPNLKSIQSFSDYVCSAIYQQNYLSILPKIARYKKVKFNGVAFETCAETMIANLINIVTYNPTNYTFGHVRSGLVLHEELSDFYKKEAHRNNTLVDTDSVHKDWLALFENKENVIYGKLLDPKSKQINEGLFVLVADEDLDKLEGLQKKELVLGEETYQVYERKLGNSFCTLVPKSTGLECYELYACASNVVMLLKRLFNIDVDMSVQDIFNLPKVAQSFHKIIESLGFKVDVSSIEQFKNNLFGNVTMKKGEDTISMYLDKGHGELKIFQRFIHTAFKIEQGVQVDKSIVATCLGCDLVKYADLTKEIKVALGSLERYVNISHRQDLISLIKNVISSDNKIDTKYVFCLIQSLVEQKDLPAFVDILKTIFIARALGFHPELKDVIKLGVQHDFAIVMDLMLHQTTVNVLGKLIETMIVQGIITSSNVTQVMELIKKRINNIDSNEQAKAIVVLRVMIEESIITFTDIDQVFEWINVGMSSLNNFVQEQSIIIINALINKGIVTFANSAQVMEWINIGMSNHTIFGPVKTLDFLKVMIDKGIVTSVNNSQVLDCVNTGLNSDYNPLIEKSIDLLRFLIDKNILTSVDSAQVIKCIDTGMQSWQPHTPEIVFDILQLVIDKGIVIAADSAGIVGCIGAAIKNLSIDQDLNLKIKIQNFIIQLLDKKWIFYDDVKQLQQDYLHMRDSAMVNTLSEYLNKKTEPKSHEYTSDNDTDSELDGSIRMRHEYEAKVAQDGTLSRDVDVMPERAAIA